MKGIPILLFLLTLSGCICNTAPVHQYLLENMVTPATATGATPRLRGMIVIGPVSLAAELESLSIVTRPGPMEIRSSSTRLWAAPLDEQMAAVISRELSSLLHSDRITVYPGPRFASPRYQVELAVERFDGMPGREFTCRLRWSISDLEEGRMVRSGRFALTLPVQGTTYRDYVAAASTALARLSRKTLAPALVALAGPHVRQAPHQPTCKREEGRTDEEKNVQKDAL